MRNPAEKLFFPSLSVEFAPPEPSACALVEAPGCSCAFTGTIVTVLSSRYRYVRPVPVRSCLRASSRVRSPAAPDVRASPTRSVRKTTWKSRSFDSACKADLNPWAGMLVGLRTAASTSAAADRPTTETQIAIATVTMRTSTPPPCKRLVIVAVTRGDRLMHIETENRVKSDTAPPLSAHGDLSLIVPF